VGDFETLRAQYFAPVCERLGLAPGATQTGTGFAIASAASGSVRVFFECERGLSCSFAVGAAEESRPLCAVEEIAKRFPRRASRPRIDPFGGVGGRASEIGMTVRPRRNVSCRPITALRPNGSRFYKADRSAANGLGIVTSQVITNEARDGP